MADVGDDMNKPSWLTSNVNAGNIITLVVLAGGAVYGYGRLENRLETIEATTATRTTIVDSKFSDIARSLENLPNLTYRVTANEEALKGMAARLDSSVSNISDRVGDINVNIGSLKTDVAVLRQQFESLKPGDRAELKSKFQRAAEAR